MSNVVYEDRGGIDWWSRLMSLGSLALAGAALWFAYQTHRDQLPSDEALSLMKSSISEAESLAQADRQKQQRAFDDLRKSWQGAIDEQLTSLRQAAYERPAGQGPETDLVSHGAEAGDEPTEQAADAAADALSQLEIAAGVTPIPDSLDSDKPMAVESAEDDALTLGENEKEATSRAPLSMLTVDDPMSQGRPDLRVVRTALKPNASQVATVSLRNAGDGPAVITSIAFEPADVIEVNHEVASGWPATSDTSRWVITFLPSENMALDEGDQGAYVKQLPESKIVKPDEEFQLFLAIENRAHIDWGMVGTLKLDFATSSSQEIEDVGLVFVAEQP